MSKKKGGQFESALQELNQIVESLEKGQVSLEDSLQNYERGIELSKQCHTLLENAEQKIQMLNKDNELVDFDE